MENRREHLKIIGAIGATCAFPFSANELYGQTAHEHSHDGLFKPPVIAPFAPQFFTVDEGALVSRIADLIIPPTDTPGAVAAGVPQYIDHVVSGNTEQQQRFRAGLAWIEARAREAGAARFIDLNEQEQIGLLTPLSEGTGDPAGVAFFHAMKSMTADGYYTSYAGLVQELGYQGNQALATFEGCVHEH